MELDVMFRVDYEFMVEEARRVAANVHRGHAYKDGLHFHHLERMVKILRCVAAEENPGRLETCAWLYGILRMPISRTFIGNRFGSPVLDLLEASDSGCEAALSHGREAVLLLAADAVCHVQSGHRKKRHVDTLRGLRGHLPKDWEDVANIDIQGLGDFVEIR